MEFPSRTSIHALSGLKPATKHGTRPLQSDLFLSVQHWEAGVLIFWVFLKLSYNQSKIATGSKSVCLLPLSSRRAAVSQPYLAPGSSFPVPLASLVGWQVWKPSCRVSYAEPHLDNSKMVFPRPFAGREHLNLTLLAKGVQLLKCLLICSLKWSDVGLQAEKKNALSFVAFCCTGA